MVEPRPFRMRIRYCLSFVVLVVLVLAAGMAAPSLAQAPSAFTVRNVEADQTAASAGVAREAAFAEGQQKAFRHLLERLTPRSQHDRLPRPTPAQIADLVESFEVQTERASAVRYIATYTFRFNPEGTRAVLRRANVRFSETYARPLVVLPVYHEGDIAVLWDEPNPWLAAWRQWRPGDGLQPLVVPLGDLADIGAISADQAQRGDRERVAGIATKYGAGGAVLVEAIVDRTRPDRPVAQVATTRFDAASGDQTVVESFAARENEDVESLLVRAAAQTALTIEEQWKSDVALQFGKEAMIVTAVLFGAPAEWVAVRDRLGETAMVRKAEVLQLSRNRAQLELHFIGTESALRLALAQKDLVLDQDGTGWQLSLGRGAQNRPRP